MNKKHILAIISILLLAMSAYAKETREIEYGNQKLVTWKFETEIGNSVGFNLDNYNPGMIGIAKFSLASHISPQSTRVFDTQASVRGYIKIKDFEIKSYVDEQTLKNNSSTTVPIKISWGDIEGSIFIHSFYLQLNANKHDRVDLIDSLDDDDLDFSVINYSIIPLRATAIYSGSSSAAIGDVLSFTIDESRGVVGKDFIESGNGSIVAGYLVANAWDLRLGLSTQYDFYQGSDRVNNPFALSFVSRYFLRNYEGFEYFQFAFKSSISSGTNGGIFLDEGNPLNLGMSVQYKFPILQGRVNLIPTVGFEAELQNHQIINPSAAFETRYAIASKNDWIISQKYEGILGIIFDWSIKGKRKDKDDHLNFRTGSQDIVTDGMSITIGYGYVPNEIFRKLQTPYTGIKFALWDSEDFGVQGIFPNLQSALILNFNHAFGGTESGFHPFIHGYENAPDSTIIVGSRTDIGIGVQLKYRIFVFEPYVNMIWKHLDVFSQADKYEIVNNFVQEEKRIYENKADLRFKVGTKITGVMNYLDFDITWESGDLIKTVIEKGSITDNDYFMNEDQSGNKIFASNTRFGYISVGATIKF